MSYRNCRMPERQVPFKMFIIGFVCAIGSSSDSFAEELNLVWPKNGAVVSLLSDAQRAYLSTATEKRVADFDDPEARAVHATIGWTPVPVTFVWSGVEWDVCPAMLEIRRESDGLIVRRDDVSLRTRNAWQVYNLESGRAYAWRVSVGGEVTEWSRFSTELGVRLINVDGVPNFRDLGGRIGLGGSRVRQGLIYRSSGANRNATTNEFPGVDRITDAGRRVVHEHLSLRTDLDLRSDEECKGMKSSPFGTEVNWVQVSSTSYQWVSNAYGRAAVAKCFRTVNNPDNLPLVFHCISGQDRTGTLAFILNALLGVSEADLSLDWEMTIFWNPSTGWFSRKGRYERMLEYFNDNFAGTTLHGKVEEYLKTCGITREEIIRFRAMMLESVK